MRENVILNEISKKNKLKKLFFKYVEEAMPKHCLKNFNDINIKGKTLIVGVGKASIPFCKKIKNKIKSRYKGIIVSTKVSKIPKSINKFDIFFAGHPIPNMCGLKASKYLINKVSKLKKEDLLIFLVSGGGSSLLPAPPFGFNLEDEINMNKELLLSGMPIQEINLIRKHFSLIKGGRLAKMAYPSKVNTFVISDIPGDDITQVSSGPTLPSLGNAKDAINCIKKYNLKLPNDIINYIKKSDKFTPSVRDKIFIKNSSYLLASAKKSMNAALFMAESMNLKAIIISDQAQGEASDVAKKHANFIKNYLKSNPIKNLNKNIVFLSGGETSVAVKNIKGKGGRNTQYLLSLAIQFELLQINSFVAMAADTDGIDGTEDNAGAFIDETSLSEIRNKNVNPEELLIDNNSYQAFKIINDLFITGPTGTNVNDFRAIIIN